MYNEIAKIISITRRKILSNSLKLLNSTSHSERGILNNYIQRVLHNKTFNIFFILHQIMFSGLLSRFNSERLYSVPSSL